jgi:hypothetical protein
MAENQELELAREYVMHTGRNVFLTGKAGTGKTTFLHTIRATGMKRMVVVAPTGVAAINAGGVTIHSFFQMPFGPILPSYHRSSGTPFIRKFNKQKMDIIRSLDLLVIDEISMVRADLLDGVDQVLRRYRMQNRPFGGVQVLMIGDMQQLAPVVKTEDWELLKSHYANLYFFNSKVFAEAQVLTIELKTVYRQKDQAFIKVLNEIRENKLSAESMEVLEERQQTNFNPPDGDGYIYLTTHNSKADKINDEKLADLEASSRVFKAIIQGDFPEHSFPTASTLALKMGAQVMFVKNDTSHQQRYYNGKVGTIVNFKENLIEVKCQDEEESIYVEQELWRNVRYTIQEESRELEETNVGSFLQYPLRLAWAITIHKSQGLTFDKAIIDARDAFAHGQAYVALSRCRSLEGLVLSSPLNPNSLVVDREVKEFHQTMMEPLILEDELPQSRVRFQQNLMEELFGFRQLRYQMLKVIELLTEKSGSIVGDLDQVLWSIVNRIDGELEPIAVKFLNQLNGLLIDHSNPASNDAAWERLKKASSYYFDRLEKEMDLPLTESSCETDNAAVKKALKDRMDKVELLLSVKKACFASCINGFTLEKYLPVRAKAFIQPKPSKRKKESADIPSKIAHPDLLKLILKWREETAVRENLQPVHVVTYKVMVQIANALPLNARQLKELRGVGKKTMEHYGEVILQMVMDYCRKADISLGEEASTSIQKKQKADTKRVTLELFQNGQPIQAIADSRNLAITTIEGHLAYFVGLGELPIDQFVTEEKIDVISNYFKKHPEAGLKQAKDDLNTTISYSDLKFVQSYLRYLGEIN